MARLHPGNTAAHSGRPALAPADSRANSRIMPAPIRSLSPASSLDHDQENVRQRLSLGKQPMRDSVQPPTPDSLNGGADTQASKRRKTSTRSSLPIHDTSDAISEEASNDDAQRDEEVDNNTTRNGNNLAATSSASRRTSSKNVRFYDPNQDEGERREVKRKSRALERQLLENRDQYMRAGDTGLRQTIERANEIFNNVKQTADATTDSRLMVGVSDIAHRKSTLLSLHDSATGIDVDEFVSKCIAFMRQGDQGAPTATQRRRRAEADDDEDEDDDGQILDWTHLGRQACFPSNMRPPVPGFLLGPLSVQKRIRAPTQRRARQRDDNRAETRPEAIEREDLGGSENKTIRHICAGIKIRLIRHCTQAQQTVEDTLSDDATDDEIAKAMRAARITATGGPSLFDFVINPGSFAQTVENMFYVSFLIKEGEVGVEMDDDGLPTLMVPDTSDVGADGQRQPSKKSGARHQAIFGLDQGTWRSLIEAFEIMDPLIPHRAEERTAAPGARGWYS